jgi:hypothetical protein
LFEEAKASTNSMHQPTALIIRNNGDEVAKLLLLHGGKE